MPRTKTEKPAFDQESRYWGMVTRELLESGAVPYDLDRRRATAIRDRQVLQRLGTRRAAPAVEEYWRGQFVDKTLSLLSGRGARRVLELGCGAGWLALEMARQGLEVDALDLSEERVHIAESYYRQRAKCEGLSHVRHQVANLEDYCPAPGVYDAIVSFTTLHHIHNKRELIEKCYKALPNDGALIVFDVERDAGPWPSRGLRGLTIFLLALLLIPLPSPVPRRRRLLEAANRMVEGLLPLRVRLALRPLVAPLLWRGDSAAALTDGSPFEGVHGDDHASLAELLQGAFDDVEVAKTEAFGFSQLLVLDLPKPVHMTLMRFLLAVDRAFVGPVLPGTATYSVAIKRTRSGRTSEASEPDSPPPRH